MADGAAATAAAGMPHLPPPANDVVSRPKALAGAADAGTFRAVSSSPSSPAIALTPQQPPPAYTKGGSSALAVSSTLGARAYVSKSRSALDLRAYRHDLSTAPISRSQSVSFGSFSNVGQGVTASSLDMIVGVAGEQPAAEDPSPPDVTMPQLNFRGQPFRETTSLLRVPTATSDASTMAEKSRGTAREIKEPRKTVASGAHWPDENESSTSDSSQSAANAAMVGASLEFTKKKKNTDFHALFRSVPEEEVLIDEFICALQREILVQGKLYVTRSHICFYANIFGWVTQLVIAFTEVVNIEKKMAALLFPSAIQIATLHSKHFFASFLSRDAAYHRLMECWNASRNVSQSPPPVLKADALDAVESAACSGSSFDSVSRSESSLNSEDGGTAHDNETGSESEGGSETASEEEDGKDKDDQLANGYSSAAHESQSDQVAASETDDGCRGAKQPRSRHGTPAKSKSTSKEVIEAKTSGCEQVVATRKRPSRPRRTLLDRKAASGGTLALLASSTLGSVVLDTAAAAAAAATKRPRSQTDNFIKPRKGMERNGKKVSSNAIDGSSAISRHSGSQAAAALNSATPLAESSQSANSPTAAACVPLAASSASDYPRSPTTCTCSADAHSAADRLQMLDEVFPRSLNVMYEYLCGDGGEPFMKQFLKTLSDVKDLNIGPWEPRDGGGDSNLKRKINYTKLLNNPLAKSTSCTIVEEILHKQFERSVSIRSTITTPDVPSGSAFSTETLTCITWAENGRTHMRVCCWVEWTAKSWIKGAVEKGVEAGNREFYVKLRKALMEFASPPAEMAPVRGSKPAQKTTSLSAEIKGNSARKLKRSGKEDEAEGRTIGRAAPAELAGSTAAKDRKPGGLFSRALTATGMDPGAPVPLSAALAFLLVAIAWQGYMMHQVRTLSLQLADLSALQAQQPQKQTPSAHAYYEQDYNWLPHAAPAGSDPNAGPCDNDRLWEWLTHIEKSAADPDQEARGVFSVNGAPFQGAAFRATLVPGEAAGSTAKTAALRRSAPSECSKSRAACHVESPPEQQPGREIRPGQSVPPPQLKP